MLLCRCRLPYGHVPHPEIAQRRRPQHQPSGYITALSCIINTENPVRCICSLYNNSSPVLQVDGGLSARRPGSVPGWAVVWWRDGKNVCSEYLCVCRSASSEVCTHCQHHGQAPCASVTARACYTAHSPQCNVRAPREWRRVFLPGPASSARYPALSHGSPPLDLVGSFLAELDMVSARTERDSPARLLPHHVSSDTRSEQPRHSTTKLRMLFYDYRRQRPSEKGNALEGRPKP